MGPRPLMERWRGGTRGKVGGAGQGGRGYAPAWRVKGRGGGRVGAGQARGGRDHAPAGRVEGRGREAGGRSGGRGGAPGPRPRSLGDLEDPQQTDAAQHRDAQGRHGTRLHQQDLQEAAAHHEAVEAVEDGHEVLAQAQPVHLHQHLHGEQGQQHPVGHVCRATAQLSATALRIPPGPGPQRPPTSSDTRSPHPASYPRPFQDILLSLPPRSSKTW